MDNGALRRTVRKSTKSTLEDLCKTQKQSYPIKQVQTYSGQTKLLP